MNDFLHRYSRYIAAAIAGAIAVTEALGLVTGTQWDAIFSALMLFGLGYLIPSPFTPVPKPPDPGDSQGGGTPCVLPFLLALAIGLAPYAASPAHAQGTAPPAASVKVTRTSLFGIAELRQANQQLHDRLLALENSSRQQQAAPQQGPQIHYHYFQGAPFGGTPSPSQPQIIIVPPYNSPLTPPGPAPVPLTPPGPPAIPLTPPGPPAVPLTPPGPPVVPLTPPAAPAIPLTPPGAPVDPKLTPPGAPPKVMPPASEASKPPTGYQSYSRLRYTHALAKPISNTRR